MSRGWSIGVELDQRDRKERVARGRCFVYRGAHGVDPIAASLAGVSQRLQFQGMCAWWLPEDSLARLGINWVARQRRGARRAHRTRT